MKKKILFVAMQMSIHTARWINQLASEDYDIHLFPVNYSPINSTLKSEITVHQPFYLFWSGTIFSQLKVKLINWITGRKEKSLLNSRDNITIKSIYKVPVLNRLLPFLSKLRVYQFGKTDASINYIYGPTFLNKLIKKLKPDLIHSLEFQCCGYNVLHAKKRAKIKFPPWLATNWGSDIYYFRKFPAHRDKITDLLQNADYYSCECKRDLDLAIDHGFKGKIMPVFPNAGGFDLKKTSLLRDVHKTSERKIILVKGYQHFAGRGLLALKVVERFSSALKDYLIHVYCASPEVKLYANELKEHLGLNIRIVPYVDHEHMLRLYSRSRIYLGLSLSDAISTSVLEAMAMGCFPIQTNTSCCNEWIENGVSGFEVPVDNLDFIAEKFYMALVGDDLVDNASKINWNVVKERLNQEDLKNKAVEMYQSIFNDDNN